MGRSADVRTPEDSLFLVKKKKPVIWRKCQGTFGKMVSRKMKSVLIKNSGYETLCSISRILTGESFSTFQYRRTYS
jgi:hypothetical protein